MMFLYEVYAPDGRCMLRTTDPRCIYPADLERAIRRAGYRIRVKNEADGADARRQ